MSRVDPVPLESAASRRWLSIVGIGEDGIDGLSPVARGLVGDAEIVFGGKRHLALAAALIRGAARPWPSPFERAVDEVLAQRDRQVCVLASGDPFVYGVGTLLARQIDPAETLVVPAPSLASTTLAVMPGFEGHDPNVAMLDAMLPAIEPGELMCTTLSGHTSSGTCARVDGPSQTMEPVRTAEAARCESVDI